MVVKGNSVNTLQDIWTNQLMGLFDLGVCIGNWAKGQMTLESHLFGDPTFHFTSTRPDLNNINEAIVSRRNDEKFWRKAMKDANADYKALAMKMLYQANQISTDELLRIQKEENRSVVRLEAFTLINKSYDKNLVPSIKLGLNDSYELQRRLAAISAANNSSPELLEQIVSIYMQPGVSKRVEFQLKSAIENYPEELAFAAIDKAISNKNYQWYKDKMDEKKKFEYSFSGQKKDFNALLHKSISAKEKKVTITSLLAEAFGWYTQSWRRDDIVNFCQEQLNVEQNEQVKSELVRTINRLKN
jgi:hypothetical protein